MKKLLIALAAAVLSGCVTAGTYKCHGFNISAPIVPVGVQVGPCQE